MFDFVYLYLVGGRHTNSVCIQQRGMRVTDITSSGAQANASRRRGVEWDEDRCINEKRMGWRMQIGMGDNWD
jgi:hypothetical protein